MNPLFRRFSLAPEFHRGNNLRNGQTTILTLELVGHFSLSSIFSQRTGFPVPALVGAIVPGCTSSPRSGQLLSYRPNNDTFPARRFHLLSPRILRTRGT